MLGPVAMEVNTMVAVGQMATLKCEPGEQPTPVSVVACYFGGGRSRHGRQRFTSNGRKTGMSESGRGCVKIMSFSRGRKPDYSLLSDQLVENLGLGRVLAQVRLTSWHWAKQQ